MSEYWLISAPGEKTCQQTWETLNRVVKANTDLCEIYKFHIPDLKVGTLDQLVGLSDDLGKLDNYVEGITRKIAHYLGEVLEDQKDKLAENLLANGIELTLYLTRFQWDMAKYPMKQYLRNLYEIVNKQIIQIENDLKTKSQVYNDLKNNLQTAERKQTGSLLSRTLYDIVRKEDFVLDSEYLTTLLVVVPKSNYNEWYANYERLASKVVPRSSKLVYEDHDNGLFTVTLFKLVQEEFANKAREQKFLVRKDFTYNEEELLAGKNKLMELVMNKKKQFGPIVRWLKVNFSECFTAWIHVKALRIFVESVLRYGLPVNFQAMLLHPNKKNARRLKEILHQHFAHLDNSVMFQQSSDSQMVEIPGISFGQQEYFPYVCYKINIDMVEVKVHK